MIEHEEQFLVFLLAQGVGANDLVASSPDSYLSYLRSVSGILGQDINPALLHTEQDVIDVSQRIIGERAPKTVRNYCSAMRQYVAFVQGNDL